ncbi:MAG: hypothetical protein JWN22_2585 [Nocardioides sp.]|nr:hypothetical protein [Nocardioides sp.]
MTSTEIRETLTEVGQAVEVPPVDAVAFQARVRAARRRRTAGRTAVATVAAASFVVAATAVVDLAGEPDSPQVTSAPDAARLPRHLVGFVVDGHLVVSGPDGQHLTDVPARNVLGVARGQVLLADGTGALVAVPVDGSGVPGAPVRLLEGEVHQAWLDRSEDRLTATDAHDRLLGKDLHHDGWTQLRGSGPSVAASGAGSWVESDTDGITLRTDGVAHPLRTGRGGVTGTQIAGGTVMVQSASGVQFYDLSGERRLGNLGGSFGALSPDGTAYAAVADATERANGMNPAVFVMDTISGDEQPVTGIPADQAGDGVVEWSAGDTFVVVTRSLTSTERTLWECTVATGTCLATYVDDTGTLQLTS